MGYSAAVASAAAWLCPQSRLAYPNNFFAEASTDVSYFHNKSALNMVIIDLAAKHRAQFT